MVNGKKKQVTSGQWNFQIPRKNSKDMTLLCFCVWERIESVHTFSLFMYVCSLLPVCVCKIHWQAVERVGGNFMCNSR